MTKTQESLTPLLEQGDRGLSNLVRSLCLLNDELTIRQKTNYGRPMRDIIDIKPRVTN